MSAASGGRSPESTSGRLENDLGNGAYGGGDLVVNGGMLVHLSSQEASVCLMALFRSEAEGGAPREERSGRCVVAFASRLRIHITVAQCNEEYKKLCAKSQTEKSR